MSQSHYSAKYVEDKAAELVRAFLDLAVEEDDDRFPLFEPSRMAARTSRMQRLANDWGGFVFMDLEQMIDEIDKVDKLVQGFGPDNPEIAQINTDAIRLASSWGGDSAKGFTTQMNAMSGYMPAQGGNLSRLMGFISALLALEGGARKSYCDLVDATVHTIRAAIADTEAKDNQFWISVGLNLVSAASNGPRGVVEAAKSGLAFAADTVKDKIQSIDGSDFDEIVASYEKTISNIATCYRGAIDELQTTVQKHWSNVETTPTGLFGPNSVPVPVDVRSPDFRYEMFSSGKRDPKFGSRVDRDRGSIMDKKTGSGAEARPDSDISRRLAGER